MGRGCRNSARDTAAPMISRHSQNIFKLYLLKDISIENLCRAAMRVSATKRPGWPYQVKVQLAQDILNGIITTAPKQTNGATHNRRHGDGPGKSSHARINVGYVRTPCLRGSDTPSRCCGAVVLSWWSWVLIGRVSKWDGGADVLVRPGDPSVGSVAQWTGWPRSSAGYRGRITVPSFNSNP